ncbi:hypothetical protein ZHAS_00008438 [Anopheles sinensis]|uniref:Uncharacterized protein n=1 Tax=Anopheles sinensis TaxID=74873 RepID=A0A084VSG3_ANOSI|nr:hypothetical protein ZHAS_00008438 [Anopheles sinensis]
MIALCASVSVLLALLPTSSRGSICVLHSFHEKFYTDLNYMVEEQGSYFWYVLAFEEPKLPYRTMYHLPKDLVSNRNCYSYVLSTQFGAIMLEFMCLGVQTLHSYVLLTRIDGEYVTKKKFPHEVSDFRVVNVLRLTKEIVLLVSCSRTPDTYGVLVLHRGPWQPAQDEEYFRQIITAKFPEPLFHWMNFTMTSVSVGEEHCNCSKEYTVPIHTVSRGGIEDDKRKVFVLVTLGAVVIITAIVKFLKRLF